MFDLFRKRQRLMMLVLLVLVFPAFVFWGISGYDGMIGREPPLATVGGQPITQREFDDAQRQQLERLRQMLGGGADPKLFDTPEARTELLDGLIAQRAVALESVARRVHVSDAQLREAILSLPGLKRDDGSFDADRYKALLGQQNLSAAGFEAQLRGDLALQALPESVQATAIVPRAVLDRIATMQEERREVRELRFSAESFAARVTPTDEQIASYYETNASAFETAESARIEYVVLDREALAARIQVGSEDLRSYYDQNRTRFGTPEERRASHILTKAGPQAKANAEALFDKLKTDPGRFEALARSSSDDPGSAGQGGDLGFFGRGMMVKPFADAVFSMKEGELRGPIETEFGQHIIRLTGIRPATEKPFEAVRAEIEREVRVQLAARQFAEAAESFTNTVYEQPDSLKPAADKYGLPILSADSVGRAPAPDAAPGSPLASARLLAAVFGEDALRNKRNTEATEIAPGRLAAARVVEYRPAQRKPLAEVRDTVRERVVRQESAKLAKQAGEARLAELKGGKVDESGFAPARRISRGDPAGLAPAVLEAAFRLASDTVPAYTGIDLGAQGYAVVLLAKVEPPTEAQIAQRRAALESQLGRLLSQQEVVDYVDALKARSQVTRNVGRLVRTSDSR
jgi:peptidyl-prolyl cis-trans isomerase D